MAKTISEEELQLKKRARRRLIGAIALMTMVAVFLPMVLDHEPRPVNQDISIKIPSPNNSGTFTSKIVPVVPGTASVPKPALETPAPARAKPDTVAKAPADYDTEAAPPKAVVPDPKPAVAKPVPQSPPATAEKTQAVATQGTGGYVVQVAALNDAGKAKEMQGKITAGGVSAYTEVVPTTKGNVTRVRAGPFATRDEAEKMRDKLKDMGLSGNIVPK